MANNTNTLSSTITLKGGLKADRLSLQREVEIMRWRLERAERADQWIWERALEAAQTNLKRLD